MFIVKFPVIVVVYVATGSVNKDKYVAVVHDKTKR